MQIAALQLLQLTQLADSAIPVGAAAHSFGLETLTDEGILDVAHLESFLEAYLAEAGGLECAFCRLSHRNARQSDQETFLEQWLWLNARLSALKVARESRVASATLGRRFLQLAASLDEHPRLQQAYAAARGRRCDIHYSTAFGLTGSLLQIDENAVVLAHLQQTLTGLISACQRLLPLGQSQASSILWHLKPSLVRIAEYSLEQAQHPEEIVVFNPMVDMASMRHPDLETRLFIS
jgi:urease accessory protein